MSNNPAQTQQGQQGQQIQIQLDEQIAQGIYSNLILISPNETEFVLDFVYVNPMQPQAKVRSRIILNPKNAKRMMLSLQQNIAQYEARLGQIDVTPPGQGGVN